tara:strand:- start:11 stop:277 length:267 start_codon:yes stop_codon:yes gene_type:complete
MSEHLNPDKIVDVIEATIRTLVTVGLTRDEALQVMLSQVAAQVTPDVMKIAAKLNEEYHYDFEKAAWQNDAGNDGKPVGTAEFALGPL